MKKRNRAFIFLIFSFMTLTPLLSFAQIVEDDTTDVKTIEVENVMENITDITETEQDFTEFTEILELLRKNPINLNRADVEELRQIPFLNDVQILNLIEHIQKHGKLLSVYELQAIRGFDQQTIEKILPFVYVSQDVQKRHVTFNDIVASSRQQIFLRYSRILEEQKGYSPASDEELQQNPNARYLGSPDKIYMRYRLQYFNSLSIGLTAEKDPGEEFFSGTQKQGFDFYSAHFWTRNIGPFTTLAIGDYNLSFGQGLALWSGLSFGKSTDLSMMKKIPRGITPYTSVEENNFFRGLAISRKIYKFEAYAFGSYKKRDAAIEQSDTLDAEEAFYYFTSLNTTGFHRTPREVERKNTLLEQLYGGRIEYKDLFLSIGATGYYHFFEHPLNRDLQPYNQFEFNAQHLWIAAVDYNYVRQNYNVFGEIARSNNGGLAHTHGLLLVPHRTVSFAINFRQYQKDYQAIYAQGFGESSKTANEHGLFTGIQVQLTPKIAFDGYYDMFWFPWLRYRVHSPSYGHDAIGQLTYRLNKTSFIQFRYRQKMKFLNSKESLIYDALPTVKNTYRLHTQIQISPSLQLKNRIELVTYETYNYQGNGFLIFQDLNWRPKQSPWALSLRYALFDTDSYEERLYAYENDVLYAYSIPAYYYRGSRYYILLKRSITRNLDIWIRFAQTYYNNRQTISSGLDEINGRTKSEIKVQMRLKF